MFAKAKDPHPRRNRRVGRSGDRPPAPLIGKKRAMRRVKSDVRNGKYRRAVDRVVLRLMCTRRVIEAKDNTLLFITVVNLLDILPRIEIDSDLANASEFAQFLFQIFYNKSGLLFYLAERIVLVITNFQDFVVLFLAMICLVIKWSRSKSP